jgi:hypothetical protein
MKDHQVESNPHRTAIRRRATKGGSQTHLGGNDPPRCAANKSGDGLSWTCGEREHALCVRRLVLVPAPHALIQAKRFSSTYTRLLNPSRFTAPSTGTGCSDTRVEGVQIFHRGNSDDGRKSIYLATSMQGVTGFRRTPPTACLNRRAQAFPKTT